MNYYNLYLKIEHFLKMFTISHNFDKHKKWNFDEIPQSCFYLHHFARFSTNWRLLNNLFKSDNFKTPQHGMH